jgi:thiosulfate dehydrogenase [quinone] large subunit
MAQRQLQTQLFGQEVKFEYSEKALGYAIVGLRIVMGWILFQGGITKVLDPTFTAAGFLTHLPEGNPFVGFFGSMAGNPVLDGLVAWGLTLTGVGLIAGALTRWCAFWGAVMMLFFWAASLTGGIAQGLPIAHGWVVDDHIVYAVLLFGLGAVGAGRILGVDGLLEKVQIVRDHPTVKYVLG